MVINYITEENLFVNADQSPVKHAASRFSVRKNVTKRIKKTKRVTPGWNDISGSGPVSFLFRSSMYYITLALNNPINLLNIVITNSFSQAFNFTYLTAWCTKELRRLELAQ